MIWLALIAIAVGVLIGAVGVGGVLLIPALTMLAPLPIQGAMATSLLTFIFTGIAGTLLFQRRGSIDWRVAAPLCVGGGLFGFAGAWAASRLEAHTLGLLLGLVILLAGIYTLLRRHERSAPLLQGRPQLQQVLLFCIGAATGFGSGLTGVGGPALSVPMMVLCGFPALTAIGASQVIQILAAVSGSVGNQLHGLIDWKLAAGLTAFEVAGVWIGAWLAHAVRASHLRTAVGVLCIAVGTGVLARAALDQPPAKAVKVPVISRFS